MEEILDLMKEGKAWSVEALARQLHTTPEDIRRKMEYLEQMGYLKKTEACGHHCSGCTSHCSDGISDENMPVFWEVTHLRP